MSTDNIISITEKRFLQLLGYEKEFISLGIGAASRSELINYIESLERQIVEIKKSKALTNEGSTRDNK